MKFYFFFLSLVISMSIQGQIKSKKQKKAENFQNEGNYSKAIKTYSKILNSDSLNYLVIVNRGICYYSIEDYESSLSDFIKFNRAYPNNSRINALTGKIYSAKNMHQEGITHLQLALVNGYNPDAFFYFNLGTNYYFLEQNKEAIEYLTKSFEMDSTFSLTLNNLGWANIEEEPRESCKYFKKAYNLDSLNYKNINNLGYSYLLCGDLEVGFELFKRAELLAPDNSFVYRNYGLYYMYKGDKEKACQNLDKAIDLKIVEEWGVKYILELQGYCSKE